VFPVGYATTRNERTVGLRPRQFLPMFRPLCATVQWHVCSQSHSWSFEDHDLADECVVAWKIKKGRTEVVAPERF